MDYLCKKMNHGSTEVRKHENNKTVWSLFLIKKSIHLGDTENKEKIKTRVLFCRSVNHDRHETETKDRKRNGFDL